MAMWYKAQFGKIHGVEVVRETDKFVVLADGSRESKDSDWHWCRPTREEAKAAMVRQYEHDRDGTKASLEAAERRLAAAREA